MKDDIHFLKELQHELKLQEYDYQAEPRFWTVGDYRTVSCWENQAEGYHIGCPNRDLYEDVDLALKEIKSNEWEDISEKAQEGFEIECEESALDWFKEYYDDGAYLIPVKEEHFIRPNTMFLTKAEAKRHIELNYYHYSSKAHTYAMTAWRAPKVERLLNILETFKWDSIKLEE